jgi:hypothetical protein
MQRYNNAIAVHEFFSKKINFFFAGGKSVEVVVSSSTAHALQRCSVAVLQLKIRLRKCKK